MPYQTCPICQGKGKVPAGFYLFDGQSSTSASAEQCKSCCGSGIIDDKTGLAPVQNFTSVILKTFEQENSDQPSLIKELNES